jgi:hypothetical protein
MGYRIKDYAQIGTNKKLASYFLLVSKPLDCPKRQFTDVNCHQ